MSDLENPGRSETQLEKTPPRQSFLEQLRNLPKTARIALQLILLGEGAITPLRAESLAPPPAVVAPAESQPATMDVLAGDEIITAYPEMSIQEFVADQRMDETYRQAAQFFQANCKEDLSGVKIMQEINPFGPYRPSFGGFSTGFEDSVNKNRL